MWYRNFFKKYRNYILPLLLTDIYHIRVEHESFWKKDAPYYSNHFWCQM